MKPQIAEYKDAERLAPAIRKPQKIETFRGQSELIASKAGDETNYNAIS